MCLDKPIKIYDKPLKKIIAYKHFTIRRSGNRKYIQDCYHNTFRKLHRLYTAKKRFIMYNKGYSEYISGFSGYISGFHAYKNLKDAKINIILCCNPHDEVFIVELYNVKVLGLQFGKQIYVAERMKILRQATKPMIIKK